MKQLSFSEHRLICWQERGPRRRDAEKPEETWKTKWGVYEKDTEHARRFYVQHRNRPGILESRTSETNQMQDQKDMELSQKYLAALRLEKKFLQSMPDSLDRDAIESVQTRYRKLQENERVLITENAPHTEAEDRFNLVYKPKRKSTADIYQKLLKAIASNAKGTTAINLDAVSKDADMQFEDFEMILYKAINTPELSHIGLRLRKEREMVIEMRSIAFMAENNEDLKGIIQCEKVIRLHHDTYTELRETMAGFYQIKLIINPDISLDTKKSMLESDGFNAETYTQDLPSHKKNGKQYRQRVGELLKPAKWQLERIKEFRITDQHKQLIAEHERIIGDIEKELSK